MSKKDSQQIRVATLGVTLIHPATNRVEMFSRNTLLDYEALILDVDGVVKEMTGNMPSYASTGRVERQEADAIEYYLEERRKQITEIQKLGRPVIAFCSSTHTILVNSARPDINIGSYLPGAGPAFHSSAGENVVFQGPEPYKTFAQKLDDLFCYAAILEPCPGKPLFFLKGTKKALGAVVEQSGKWTLLSPKLKPTPRTIISQNLTHPHRFVEAALELFRTRTVSGTEFAPPAWQSSYILQPERPLLDRRNAERQALQQAQQKLSATEANLKALDELKRAFTSNGDVLVDIVANLLRSLGLTVEPGPEVKDDLIARGHGHVFVIEVKGRDKTGSGEKDARQLDSWVSRYAHEHDQEKEPKGLLIVNGYKDLPLDQRMEPTFPHAMLDYVQRKQQCAITGTQLLCLALEAQQQRNEAAIVGELGATTGIFPRYQGNDWSKQIAAPPKEK